MICAHHWMLLHFGKWSMMSQTKRVWTMWSNSWMKLTNMIVTMWTSCWWATSLTWPQKSCWLPSVKLRFIVDSWFPRKNHELLFCVGVLLFHVWYLVTIVVKFEISITLFLGMFLILFMIIFLCKSIERNFKFHLSLFCNIWLLISHLFDDVKFFYACFINALTYHSNILTFLFTNKIQLKCFTHV
jgi:hypothetical protein